MVSKVFKKLVNNKLVDHLEKCDLFSNFQYGFRSSGSTADPLAVVSDRIARTFIVPPSKIRGGGNSFLKFGPRGGS